MALARKVNINVDSTTIKDYLNLSLQQNVFGHHLLQVICRREDILEENEGIILDKSDKLLGGNLSLMIKIDDEQKVEFNGIVTRIKANKMNDTQSDTIILEASSPDILMDDGEHCRSFEKKTLKSIVETIIKEYNVGTSKVNPEQSKDTLAYTVQYKESAYGFISRMASKKGEWFYYDGTELIFGKRNTSHVDLEFGVSIFNLDYSLKIEDLKFKYKSYDYLKTEDYEGDSEKQKVSSNLSDKAKEAYKVSEDKFKHETVSLYNHSLTEGKEQSHLDDRVKLTKSALASGLVSCSGSTDNGALKLGCEINVTEKFKKGDNTTEVKHGSYIITSLSHSCDRSGNYQNNFTGIPKEIDVPPYSSPHAIPFCETQSATVMDNNDPEKLGRVQVQFLWQKPDNQVSPWIRAVTPHSGKDQGFVFIPEIGDEVLAGFEGGNAEKPYVIGNLFNGKAKPDSSWMTDKNDVKAIRTRSGHTIEFNDKDGSEEIKIYDNGKDNYTITLSSKDSKITIESKGDLDMTAGGNMTVKAGGNMTIEAASDLKVDANNIAMNAGVEYKSTSTNSKSEASAEMEMKAGAGMKMDGGAMMTQKAATMKLEGTALIEQKAAMIKLN